MILDTHCMRGIFELEIAKSYLEIAADARLRNPRTTEGHF